MLSETGIAELFLVPVSLITNPVALIAAAWGALLGHTLVNDCAQSASSVLHAISLGFVITYLSSMTLAAVAGLPQLARGGIGGFVVSIIVSGFTFALVTQGGTFLSGCLFALMLMKGSGWYMRRRGVNGAQATGRER